MLPFHRTAEFAGTRTDANLKNAWGLGFDNAGNIFVSSNHAGVVLVYDISGNQAMSPITVAPRSSSVFVYSNYINVYTHYNHCCDGELFSLNTYDLLYLV